MALHWSWGSKKGEVIIAQNNYKNPQKIDKVKVNIYQANCLGAFIYEWKDPETKEEKYQVYTWFEDVKHLKKCLGLVSHSYYDCEKGKRVSEKTNILTTGSQRWKKVRLNTYYPDSLQMANIFAKGGVNVEIYYEAPKEKNKGE